MLKDRLPLFLAGKPVHSPADIVVRNKFTGDVASRVACAGPSELNAAIDAADRSFERTRRMPAFARQRVLRLVAARIEDRRDEFAHVLAVEAGKPIRDARGEVARAIDTFRIASEEATRLFGEWLPLDISERAADYEGITRRFPLGPCGFITPFNFPLNLAAHKIAPAIAVGCPWVLKPASATPITALLLGEILAESDLPPGAFSILPCSASDVHALVADPRVRLLSFTGSPAVGWELKARAGRKKVALELGGNAACIVDRDADVNYAADRITFGAFYQSGQSCISVQRVLAHRSLIDTLRPALVERAGKLASGDPLDERTFLGPLISEQDAIRVESWVRQAVDAGATLLCGGRRFGPFFQATWLENVDRRQPVSCVEVFGPVATLSAFDDFNDALHIANDSDFGLQCGLFTRDLGRALRAYETLDVGGVIINDVPAFRVDNMPYGGVKDSGLGREGVRYAMQEMTEIKLLVLNRTNLG